ncbi:MAG: hypothetical protein U1A78_33735 [Polyangia bacterium]
MYKRDVFGPLEEFRIAAEGDPVHGAFLGALIAALLEAGRFAAVRVEAAADAVKALSGRIDAIREKLNRGPGVLNLRRRESALPRITEVSSAITGGGGTVGLLGASTSTDIAGRLLVVAGGDGTDADASLARVTFSQPFEEPPLVLLQQDSGTEAELRTVNVSAWSFDVVSGTGVAADASLTVSYLIVPTAQTQVVALGGSPLPAEPPPFVYVNPNP